jgi:hypothetical protein
MEEFKKLEEVTSADGRTTSFVLVNRETGQKREFGIGDLHEEVEMIKLDETVPEEVQSQFNVARNLCLYSWYCYSFHNVACLQAYSTIELALRIRLGKAEDAKCTLRPLLDEALSKGLISEDWMPEGIAYLRNISAHGKLMIHPWSVMILRGIADNINQLFAPTHDTSAD